MTLNFTSYSAFPASIRSDDDFGPVIWNRGAENCGGGPCWLDWEMNDSYDNGGGGIDWADRNVSYDPVDLLPDDPFGMDFSSTLAIIELQFAGWIEDYRVNSSDCMIYDWDSESESGHGVSGHGDQGGCGLGSIAGLGDQGGDGLGSIAGLGISGWLGDQVGDGLGSIAGLGISGHGDQGCGGLGYVVDTKESHEEGPHAEGLVFCPEHPEEGPPHEGLVFCLEHLGVQDLLSVERVCRSLRSAVQNDSLVWRHIHIDSPLSERITDDVLLRLTQRAQGSLECLSLIGCSRITDEGLRCVLEGNLKLQKLGVSGCLRLSIEGLINNLKAFKSSGVTGIKHLKLGRWFAVSPEYYEELQLLLGEEGLQQSKVSKPRFYHCGPSCLPCKDDDRPIDIEMCPECQKFKLIFDCPSESCREKGVKHCRACGVCIGRCMQCGRCVNDCRFVETFFLDYLCSGCWKQPIPSQESLEEE